MEEVAAVEAEPASSARRKVIWPETVPMLRQEEVTQDQLRHATTAKVKDTCLGTVQNQEKEEEVVVVEPASNVKKKATWHETAPTAMAVVEIKETTTEEKEP